ncbi:MAG TPA: cytochrome c [Anaeromyxobacteraceae bacterium]|nr:cytochrome c [Anaeromyxobacteraceae bacterium]
MSRRLALLLLPALALTACPRLDPMQRQQKYKAYQVNGRYDDGLAMRGPPRGAVPYGPLLDPAVATGRGPDGRPVALLPVAVDAKLLARGRQRFDITCAACHGVLGDGESQVALNMSLRRPPSLHEFRDLPDGTLYQIISEGFGLMPSYATELTVQDRWAVVAYVRALQLSQHATVDQVPPDVRRRLEEGR